MQILIKIGGDMLYPTIPQVFNFCSKNSKAPVLLNYFARKAFACLKWCLVLKVI